MHPQNGLHISRSLIHEAAKPQRHAAPVHVNVTTTKREALVDGLAFEPDHFLAATIRTHLWLQRNARELLAHDRARGFA